MGYMDMEGSGPSLAVKEHLPPPDQPTALSSPPPKLVLPEPIVPDSDSDFEVRLLYSYTWLIRSDSGDRRMDLAVPGAAHRNLIMPSPSPWPNPRASSGLCHSQ